jgi:hypothetical protein
MPLEWSIVTPRRIAGERRNPLGRKWPGRVTRRSADSGHRLDNNHETS